MVDLEEKVRQDMVKSSTAKRAVTARPMSSFGKQS